MRELPTGTVTFLFTDIEGSTMLLDDLGAERYADALSVQRRIVREAYERHEGVEVDTQGDAFFIAFPTAPAALEAAEDAQRALGGGSVRVRMGIHTGTPHVTEEGYVGSDVHKAARIAAAGHGGQILVSASAAALLKPNELFDLGEHRLKDLSAPERIYQLGTGEFPPLRSLFRTNLPIPATPFLGREQELVDVLDLIARPDVRLLTLTGSGGSGKTRLGLQAAADASDRYPDGVFWVPLSALRDPGLVLASAGLALGANDGLAEHVGDKRALLLFDNFEHVLDAGADLAAVLAACPNLDALVTSREPLHLRGEHEYPVPPLAHQDAVALLIARARAVDPAFAPDDAVPEICRRVDELPLAIELAAARVKALPPSEILKRLERRLPFLTGGARDLPQRQRTLRATMEWSYDLLTLEEQRLFARLAIFAGGCTLHAAEHVVAADVDTLQSLVGKSLVRHAGGRYWMLESVREYASERLEDSGVCEELGRRLAEYLLAFAERELAPPDGIVLQRPRLSEERDNLRAAIAQLLQSDDTTLALRLAIRGSAFGTLPAEQAHWLDEALPRAEVSERLRLDAFVERAAVAWVLNDYTVSERFGQRALDGYRQLGDLSRVSRVLRLLGVTASSIGDTARARALIENALAAAEQAGDQRQTYHAIHALAELQLRAGNLETAASLFARSMELAEAAGEQLHLTNIFHGMGDLALARGDMTQAAASYRRSLRLSIELRFLLPCVSCVAGLAAVAAGTGETIRAGELWGAAETLERELGFPLLTSEKAHYGALIRTDLDAASARFAAAVERGRRMSVDEIYAYALAEG